MLICRFAPHGIVLVSIFTEAGGTFKANLALGSIG